MTALFVFKDGRTVLRELPGPVPVYLVPARIQPVLLFAPDEPASLPVHYVHEFVRAGLGRVQPLLYEER